jgi:hypothetical protein
MAAMTGNAPFRRGELVEVRPPLHILRTLDADGAIGGLPFMPEMLGFVGKRFRVEKRILKTCVSIGNSTNMRVFNSGAIVTLEGVRCSGEGHDGCQKLCAIFWHEEWLRKVDDSEPGTRTNPEGTEQLGLRLKTTVDSTKYFCQASELLRITRHLSRWERFGRCFAEVRTGNCSAWEMAQRIGIWLYWRARRRLLGVYARGTNRTTPSEALNLQPGEFVEVKPIGRITETLDPAAHNRGLYFTPDMALFCGSRQRVARRLDKIIVDGTGQMRSLRNTVYLEGAHCGCSHVAFGGCPRGELSYWREIWLQRPQPLPPAA